MKDNLETLIIAKSHAIADEMKKIAQRAESEEDVRHECNKLIDDFIAEAGLLIKGHHEVRIGTGRLDSKYQGVLLEYKYPKGPGRITEKTGTRGNREVIEQLKTRVVDFEQEAGYPAQKLFGVGTDGNTLIFVRYRGGKWEIEEPKEVTPYTIERLLRALISLSAQGLSFTPENLTEHFGADSPAAQQGIRRLHEAILTTKSKKAKTFFNQWKILFSEVCGYDIEGRNEKIRRLGEHYGARSAKPAELLFSVHTYYAIFMKYLAAEIASSFSPLGTTILKKCAGAETSAKLRREMEQLEQGGIWNQLGISNFLEGDLFSWYLDAWNENIAQVVRVLVNTLGDYDPSTLSVEPAESRDLLKKLYQHLFPKSVRHDLGEYYTPDWLAEHVLNELGYEGDPDKRLLDPACGSGTFLVMAVNRVKSWFEAHRLECGYGETELVQRILKNIIGFDLNPLAIMAARTNYLLAIRDLLRFTSGVEIPVYLCDSIMTPFVAGSHVAQTTFLTESSILYDHENPPMALKTSAGTFFVPAEIARSRERIGRYADTVEFCVRNEFDSDQFITRCKDEGLPVAEEHLHRVLYERLGALDAENQNGIWARIIKNAFAPLFIERVDYVAGNPPWINWESLPPGYRNDMKALWQEYGLFSLSGKEGRLGGGKKDLSMLFVYSAIDNYVRDKGRLGFVITQTVFKTKGAGDGFRRFRFGDAKNPVVIKPLSVDDMSDFLPFEGAANRTAVLVCQRHGKPFEYPIDYTVWRGPSRIDPDASLEEVAATTQRRKFAAIPVDREKITSPWLTAPVETLPGIEKVIGKSHYEAHAGVYTGGLNGCYWVRILEKRPNGNLLIENLYDVGKIKVERVQAVIEPDLVYPLLRGRDVKRWHAEPSTYIVLAQDPATRAGIPETEMKRKYPKTFAYLKNFEEQLRQRASSSVRRLMETGAFYSMFAVGPYTLAPWKVVWNRIDTKLQGVVVGLDKERKVFLCQETHTFAPLASRKEALYFSAVFNSAPSDVLVRSYSVSKGFASPHVLEFIFIPQYKEGGHLHEHLITLSEHCHSAAAKGDKETVSALEAEIDKAAAKLWGITDDELRAIQEALREMEAPRRTEGENETMESDD